MRHLCAVCSALKVGNTPSPIDHSARMVESTYDGITYLLESAEGSVTGKACHFCALVLRSLRHHHHVGTEDEKSYLPSGLIALCLTGEFNEEFSLVATCGFFRSYPIQLALEADESCRGSEVSSSASSDQVFSQIRSWCNDCVNKHPRCSIAKSSLSWLPSRVVDLGSSTGPMSAKLVETKGSVGQYITITHRWTELTGPSSTTIENYEARKQAIDVTALSLPFQDVFEAVFSLGVRYLWIDALCIIQNSGEDWGRESSNMRSIYELAWLNIAVAGSEKVDGRLFMKRTPRISRPCRLPDSLLSSFSPAAEGPLYAYLASQYYAKAVFEGFLTRRGWILQERILSPRTIYFGQEEVFWECSTITASETIPWGWKDTSPLVKFNTHDLALNPRGLLNNDDESSKSYSPESPHKVRRVFGSLHNREALSPLYKYWYRLVEAYTSKKLTKSADRLPAIFGLAQALHKSGMPHKIFTECYQDGVWLPEPASLLWHLQSDPATPGAKIEGAPSYSWGSWNGPSSFIANECEFVDQSQVVAVDISDSLGGHPADQATVITAANLARLPTMLQKKNLSRMLQVQGQLDIAKLQIIKEKEIALHDAAGGSEERSEGTTKEFAVELFSHNADHPAIMLDSYPDRDLKHWLDVSDSTVWLLKLAIGKDQLHPTPASRANWKIRMNSYLEVSHTSYYDYGLILVPSKDDVDAIKEVQELTEPWNLPEDTTTVFGRYSHRSVTPPPKSEDDPIKWMQAKRRVNLYSFLGPHNTAFRRIGIYRAQASTFKTFQERNTAVLLT